MICPRTHSQERAEPGLDGGFPKLQTCVSTCLLDIRSRNSPDPSSQLLAWTLVLAFPRAWSSPPQSVPAAQGLGQPLRVLCTVLGDSTAPGWVLSQLQLQWPSQAHIPNPGPPLGEHLSSLDLKLSHTGLRTGRYGKYLTSNCNFRIFNKEAPILTSG